MQEHLLIGMPLQEALTFLQGYDITLQETSANEALTKKINETEFATPRVIKAVLNEHRAVLVYCKFKEIAE